mgnify:CR=1 FL=1
MEELSSKEYQILDELYERITYGRVQDEDFHLVMHFWNWLNHFRERDCHRMRLSYHSVDSEDHSVTSQQASCILGNFNNDAFWFDHMCHQQQR